MNTPLTINIRAVQRIVCTMLAALLIVAGLPFLAPGSAKAANQLSNRSIQLSDSAASGGSITTGVGSGTSVTYQVSFTTLTAADSLVIDFCSNDPIINDTCTAPTGMVATAATTSAITGNIGGTGWAITANASRVKLTDTVANAHPITVGAQIFRLIGITNPSTTGSFYARIYTWSNNTYGGANSNPGPGNTGGTGGYDSAQNVGNNYLDYGGVALSTAAVIQITARVQETLTFCVTAADPDTWLAGSGGSAGDCSASEVAAAPPIIQLGHGAPTKILDANTVDLANVWTQLSTNATHGAVINMRNNNLTCTHPGAGAVGGGLSADAGTTCAIPATNGGAATAAALPAGTAAFGLFACSYTPAVGVNGVGSVTATAPYNDGIHVSTCNNAGNNPTPSNVWFGMDNTTSTAAGGVVPATYNGAVSGLFGSSVATTTAPVYRADDRYMFAATASLTTPAGVYQANLSMIATGTF